MAERALRYQGSNQSASARMNINKRPQTFTGGFMYYLYSVNAFYKRDSVSR